MSAQNAAVADAVCKALRRAFSLGQTYWQQADSESYFQNKKADATKATFEELVTTTAAMLSASKQEGEKL